MLLLICIIGIVLGLIHRQRAERPLTIMVISLGVLALDSLAVYTVEPIVYGLFASQRGGGVSGLLGLWNAVTALIQAGATAGLIVAVLCDRGLDLLNFSRPTSAAG